MHLNASTDVIGIHARYRPRSLWAAEIKRSCRPATSTEHPTHPNDIVSSGYIAKHPSQPPAEVTLCGPSISRGRNIPERGPNRLQERPLLRETAASHPVWYRSK